MSGDQKPDQLHSFPDMWRVGLQVKKAKHGKRAKLERPNAVSSDSDDERPSPAAAPPAATGSMARESKPGGDDRDERSAGGRSNVDATRQGQLKDRGGRGVGAGARNGVMSDRGGDRRGRDERDASGGQMRDEREGEQGGTDSRHHREVERRRTGQGDVERPRRRSRSRYTLRDG